MPKKVKDISFLKAFGSHLKQLREAKGISQENLAADANIAENQIYLIEQGVANPTLNTFYSISKALNVSHKELMAFEVKDASKKK